MHEETVKRFLTIFDSVEADKRLYEPLLRDVSLLVQPSRSTEEDRRRGRDRSIHMYDDTAIVASTRFAATLFGTLTNPALEWLVLQPANKIANTRDAKFWLDDAKQLLFSVFRSPGSGFNSAISEAFLDLASFGTTTVFIDGEDLIRFNTLSLDEIYFAQNHKGIIDTVFRKKLWTADQAAGLFGLDNLSDAAKGEYQDTNRYTKRREYLHVVMPSEDIKQDKKLRLKINSRFASIYIDKEAAESVRESGYDTFPYAAARWKVASGEIYGTGPGIEVIDEIRLANAMKKAMIAAQSKAADPPLLVDDDTVIGKLRALPGGITYRQPGKTIEQLPTGDPRVTDDSLRDIRAFIEKAFFQDVAQLPDIDRMTATEASIRKNDRLQVLSPFITRIQEELLDPIIRRTLDLAVRKGELAPPPPELQRDGITVEYVSPLAISQRSSRLQAVDIWINSLLPIGQIDPDVFLAFNTDAIAEFTAEALNIPPELVRTQEEIAQIKQERQELARLQQAAQVGREVAETAKTAAEAQSIAGRIGA